MKVPRFKNYREFIEMFDDLIIHEATKRARADFCELLTEDWSHEEMESLYKELKKKTKSANYLIAYLFEYLLSENEVSVKLVLGDERGIKVSPGLNEYNEMHLSFDEIDKDIKANEFNDSQLVITIKNYVK